MLLRHRAKLPQRIRRISLKPEGYGGGWSGLLRERVLDRSLAAHCWRSTKFIQEGESAEQDAEWNPEMNVGCDGAEEVASGAFLCFGRCRFEQSKEPRIQWLDAEGTS